MDSETANSKDNNVLPSTRTYHARHSTKNRENKLFPDPKNIRLTMKG